MKMNDQCGIVQDLLPLYVDDICSEGSRVLVEEHIAGCAECTQLLRSLKNSEIEEAIQEEKNEVIKSQRRLFKRKSAFAGAIIAGILMIPVIVCLIVNLAVGNGMGWFFIVLASLMLAASLIVVPLMAPKNKALWTITAGTASLILLLVIIGLTSGGAFYWSDTFAIVVPILVYIWGMFVLIRFVKLHGLARAGLCCIFSGGFLFAINNMIGFLIGYDLPWPAFYPNEWNAFTVDGNVRWVGLIGLGIIGIIFLITGVIISIVKHNKK